MRYEKKCRKPFTAQFEDEWGKRNFWTRSQLKQILGYVGRKNRRQRKTNPMPEATFKRRLALLEAECPECDRSLYNRKFSDFTKWCLVRLEEIFIECDRDINKTRNYLQNIGLNTDDYFQN
jgi:ssDNA-binding Zn-finger/Zn-ribbon topoisomerase 1